MVWPCSPPTVCPDWCCLCFSCSAIMLGGGFRGKQQRNQVCPWHLRSKTIDIADIPMRKVGKMGSFHYFLLWSLQPSVLYRQMEAQRLKAFAQSHRAQEARIQNTRCFSLFSITSLPKGTINILILFVWLFLSYLVKSGLKSKPVRDGHSNSTWQMHL